MVEVIQASVYVYRRSTQKKTKKAQTIFYIDGISETVMQLEQWKKHSIDIQ